MKYKIRTNYKKLLADTLTPVNIYLKLRDVFAGSILLESSDYHARENSLSLICCSPIASFTVQNGIISEVFPDGNATERPLTKEVKLAEVLTQFKNAFEVEKTGNTTEAFGLFGYTTYDAVRYFEDVSIAPPKDGIPDIIYKLFRYVIVVDHFFNELRLHEFYFSNETSNSLERIEQLIFSNRFSTFKFKLDGNESSNVTDQEFMAMVENGKQHCFRGDVFQIVLSRRFVNTFKGDEFNVYRALRSINPSPYLFYFDFGSFKLFGSSPEAQLQIKNNQAFIYPIAGTFRRTGNDQEDAKIASQLSADEKENAEHVMLVDLARNDMSRNAHDVKVEVFKEIQYYSHVIHLVSKVSGRLSDESSTIQMFADTFPAGTLSGAPKVMAMNLINKYENVNRSFYGGAIGLIGFDGSLNKAIMIRTFLSRNNQLIYQAGAGIVSKSDKVKELQEVNNKLEALRKAVRLAESI